MELEPELYCESGGRKGSLCLLPPGTGGAGREGVKDPNEPFCEPLGAPLDALRKPDMVVEAIDSQTVFPRRMSRSLVFGQARPFYRK